MKPRQDRINEGCEQQELETKEELDAALPATGLPLATLVGNLCWQYCGAVRNDAERVFDSKDRDLDMMMLESQLNQASERHVFLRLLNSFTPRSDA